jgi:dsRNA-specific ribonuclease
MFDSFFERKSMERIIAVIMHAYKELLSESVIEPSDDDYSIFLAEVSAIGVLLYAREMKINEVDLINFLLEKLTRHIDQYQELSLEFICFSAASLRGDFSKHSKKLGEFFGDSARKLNLNRDVFKKYPVRNSAGFLIAVKMAMVKYN